MTMTQATLEKINSNISRLQKETEILRSFVVGMAGRDEEGEYRPEFVKRVLNSIKDDEIFELTGKECFFKKLKNKT